MPSSRPSQEPVPRAWRKRVFEYNFIGILLVLNTAISAQSYQMQLLNKGALYTNASALHDYDGDGDLDIIITRLPNDNTPAAVEWLENDGTGQFPRRELFRDLVYPVDIDLGDFDNDGDVDYLVSDRGTLTDAGQVAWLQRQADGSYIKWTVEAGVGIYQAAAADFDRNGTLDVVAVGFDLTTINLYLHDGFFNFARRVIKESVIQVSLVEADDIDQDGDEDLVIGGGGQDFQLLYQDSTMVFRKTLLELNWNNQASGSQMSVGDLDGDGDLDLVFPENGNIDGDLSWFENIGGKLYRHYLYAGIRSPRFPKFGDLDADGDLDVVVSAGGDQPSPGFQENEIFWHENRGASGFIEWRIDEGVGYPYDVELADLDGDNRLDIAATLRRDNDLVWYKKNGVEWQRFTIEGNANQPVGCEVADIDNDGDLDLALCSSGDDKFYWYLNNGSGSFSRRVVDANLKKPHEVKAGDLDEDGDIDLAVAAADTGNTLVLYLNNGQQTFTKKPLFTGKLSYQLEIGDWDGDGRSDILAAFNAETRANDPKDVIWFRNLSAANFEAVTLIAKTEETFALKLADVDSDDDLDLIYGFDFASIFASSNLLNVGINQNGQIISTIAVTSRDRGSVVGIDAGDFNQDGFLDLVASDIFTNDILLFAGGEMTQVEDGEEFNLPVGFTLSRNYPNPFNPSTIISFSLPRNEHVQLRIYNVLGEEVARLLDEELAPGTHQVQWRPQNLPSGVYLYRLQGGGFAQTRKLALVR